jgi:hypothetical protein
MMMRLSFHSILYGVSIAMIVLVGILLRIGPHIDFSHVGEGNLSAYYFDKFNRIVITGRLAPYDVWEFAPDARPENVPPGAPYAAAGIFALARLAFPHMNALTFAAWFPVITYTLFGLVAFLLFALRERSMLAAVLMLAIISLAPISASYTEYGYFVQEPLGAFFLFLATYFLANVRRTHLDVAAAIASIAALSLTWQQFPFFVFAILALIIGALIIKRFSEAKAVAITLVAGLLVAEFISRVIIGIQYSVWGMIKEIVLGAWLLRAGDSDLISAMTNVDWRRGTLEKFYRWYGPLTALLFLWGMVTAWLRRRDFRHLAAFVFGIAAAGLLWQFQKERIFGFGLLLFPVGMGAMAFERGGYAFDWQMVSKKRKAFGVGAVLVLGAILFAVYGGTLRDRFFAPPQPVPDVTLERQDNPDGTIDLTVRLTNRGGTTYAKGGIFWDLNTGLHLEVENADILEFEANSPLKSDEWYPYHVYPYIRLGNTQFLETRYRQLKNGQSGDARVKIKPTADGPVRFYWRGWLTDVGCTNEFERKSLAGFLPKFDPGLENCVVRFPAHDARGYLECPIDIASHRVPDAEKPGAFGLKPLPCAVLEL